MRRRGHRVQEGGQVVARRLAGGHAAPGSPSFAESALDGGGLLRGGDGLRRRGRRRGGAGRGLVELDGGARPRGDGSDALRRPGAGVRRAEHRGWRGGEAEQAPAAAGAGLGVLLGVRAQPRSVLSHPQPEGGEPDEEEGHRAEAEALGVGERGHRGVGADERQHLQRLPGNAAAERDPERRVRPAGEERQAQRAEGAGRAADDDGGLADRRLPEGLGEAGLLLASAGDQLPALDETERGEPGLERHLVRGALGEERPADHEHPHRAGLLVRAEQRERRRRGTVTQDASRVWPSLPAPATASASRP